MGFFTSDLKLANVYADPTVRQAISPGQARTWAGDSMGIQGMLSNLGRSTQQTSGAFNYNIPSAEQLWSQINPGAGAIGGTGGVGVGAIGGTGGGAIGGTIGTGDQMTVPLPITDIGGIPGITPVSDGGVPIGVVKGADSGSDYTEPYTAPMSLEEYLQSKEQTPGWLTSVARTVVPGFSAMSTFADISRGINPFYNKFGSSVLGEAPTYDWYEGNTDAFGNPYSDATLSSWMNSPSAVEERNIVDMYGFGSDQHMDFLDRGADEGLEGADETDLFGEISDWFSNTFTSPTSPVEVVDKSWGYTQAPEVVEAPIPGVEYGHPEVITPTEYMDSAPSGVTDTGGYEDSSTGESFSASDFSAGGNMSDWGSAEEYADDFGFDDWGDWGDDDDGGFE